MRRALAAIVMVTWPAMAAAQSPAPARAPLPSLPAIGLPLPEIAPPLPRLGLPLLPMESPPPGTSDARSPRGPRQEPPRFGSMRRTRSQPAVVFFVHDYRWGTARPAATAAPGTGMAPASWPAQEQERVTGVLRLDLHPIGAAPQLYADGVFVGTPDDFRGDLRLRAGRHTIEIRAPGFETIVFAVEITAGRSITYRGTLRPTDGVPASEPAAAPAAGPSPAAQPPAEPTFYLIPGCYMGNVPPAEVALPADCDRSRTTTHRPGNVTPRNR